MTDLELYLDHNMIYRKDGSFVLNSKYEVFVEGLEAIIRREKFRIIDDAASEISKLKADLYIQEELPLENQYVHDIYITGA